MSALMSDYTYDEKLSRNIQDASDLNDYEELNRLITNNIDTYMEVINEGDMHGFTPLLFASSHGSLDCLKLLVEKGAAVNKSGNCGRLPLHYAACNGHTECIEVLLNYEADINARDDVGMTPLMYAANHEFIECVELLLKRGADQYLKDFADKSTLDYADTEPVKELLLQSLKK